MCFDSKAQQGTPLQCQVNSAALKKATSSSETCLVIILGQTRAHELTFGRFKSNVLDVLKADLALAIGGYDGLLDPFVNMARYVWMYPEPANYESAFEFVRKHYAAKADFRTAYSLGGIWLGPLNNRGSGAINMFYRWFALYNLNAHDVLSKYSRFLITRSDQLFLTRHPDLLRLDPKFIWVPWGEDYGGICDRYMLVSSKHVVSALDMIVPVITNPKELTKNLSALVPNPAMRLVHNDWPNSEQHLRYHLTSHGLWKLVKRSPRPMITVRDANTTTRGSKGRYSDQLKLFVKYPKELVLADATLRLLGEDL